MSFTVEKNENSVALIKMDIPQEAFQKGLQAAYNKNKGQFNIAGFRKGKAPRSVIEARYGKSVFYEDALDESFSEVYAQCVIDSGLEVVASPQLISIDEISEDGAKLTLELSLKPKFELPPYKGIKVGSLKYTSKKADVEAEYEILRDKNARLVSIEDGESETGDTVYINFEGFVGDAAFEGGKAENYSLVIGSNTFIPGFEDQLIGSKVAEKFDVNVTFPENYHSEELKGREAVFKTEILDIKRKELPALDDDLAVDLGFDDLKALEKDVKAKLKEKKEKELRAAAQSKIVNRLSDEVEITLAPRHIAERAEQFKREYEDRLTQSGIDPEMYYQYITGTDGQKDTQYFNDMFASQAEREIKTELVMAKIIETEKIEATEEDLEKEYENLAGSYKQSKEEFVKNLDEYSIHYIRNLVVQNKLFDFLIENADTSK